jgi:imidazolonepropionase-like amidohydrolase
VEQGLIVGPRLQISITALSTTGGHGDSWMPSGVSLDVAYPGCPSGICDGVEQVRQKVREVLRAGAEVVKVCTTGGVLSPTDHPEATQFTVEELQVMVQEATFRRGLKVMAHAQGAPGIKQAIRAGIHSIEHGIFLDDDVLDMMIKNGAFLVPTLTAPRAALETAEQKGTLPEFLVQKAKAVLDIHTASAARAYKAGVTIAMGTDSGVGPHGTNLRELGLLCDIGMSPMEAIVAATRTAARCLGWQDRIGTVEPGKLADLVVAAADPLANIRSLEKSENIVLVMKDGKVLKDTRAA